MPRVNRRAVPSGFMMKGPTTSGLAVGRDVGDVVAGPFAAVPPQQLAARIPGVAVHVGRRAIVENAAVDRPGPRPFGVDAGRVGIAGVAAGHVVAGLVVAAGIDPAAACRLAVVAQGGEADDLLALGEHDLARVVRIGDVLGRVAVDFLGQLVGRRIAGILVAPVQIEDRLGKRAALLLIERLEAQVELRHDPGIVLGFAGRRAAGPVPLQPAAGIGERARRPRRSRCVGSSNHLGLDLRRVDVVVLAVVLPEPRRLRLQRIHDDEELELGERRR